MRLHVITLICLLMAPFSARAQLAPFVTIQSTPPGAAVFIDSKAEGLRGNTPLRLRLPRGQHHVILEFEGYAVTEQMIAVAQEQKFSFKLATSPARLDIKAPGTNASAHGAEVFLDGSLIGTVPILTEAPAGRHLLEVRRPGYQAHGEQIEVRAGELRPVWVQLAPDASVGSLLVSSDAPGEVLIDGQPRGPAPVTVDGLSVGQHQIEVHRAQPGAEPWRGLATILPRQLAQIAATFTPRSAGVALVGKNPSDRYTVAAGGMVCTTPCAMQLPPGPATLDISGRGQNFTRTIEIPSGPSTVRIRYFTKTRITAGAVLMGLAIPLVVGGSLLAVQAASSWSIYSRDGRFQDGAKQELYSQQLTGSTLLLVHGAAFFFTGVGLLSSSHLARVEVIGPEGVIQPAPTDRPGFSLVSW